MWSAFHDDLTSERILLESLSYWEKINVLYFLRFSRNTSRNQENAKKKSHVYYFIYIYISVLNVDDSFDKGCFKAGVVAISNFSTCYLDLFYRVINDVFPPPHPRIRRKPSCKGAQFQAKSSSETGTDPIIYFTGRLISRTLHRAKIYVFSRIELCYLLYDSADERNGFPIPLALPPPTYRHPPSYVLPKESFLATTAVPPKHRQLLMLPFDFPSLSLPLSLSRLFKPRVSFFSSIFPFF